MLLRQCLAVLVVASAVPACVAAEDEPAAASEDQVVGRSLEVTKVEGALAKLDQIRGASNIRAYYADGARLEGCWANPAGRKLTDLKKAFYCSMPLELRLCNTVVLLRSDEADVATRKKGYLDCQKKVDAVFGGHGQFRMPPEVDAVYEELYLKGAPLASADAARVVEARRPAASGTVFPVLLARIAKSVVEEAADLAVEELLTMKDDFADAGGQAR